MSFNDTAGQSKVGVVRELSRLSDGTEMAKVSVSGTSYNIPSVRPYLSPWHLITFIQHNKPVAGLKYLTGRPPDG